MDPLSIGASVITVVGATGKVIKEIRRLKTLQDAPRELDDLLAEVSQFELVLQAIHKAHEEPGSELKELLETAQRILVDLESLIEYKLTEAGTSNKVDRWQWTRSSKEVERLRGQLRIVTANLVALVGVNTRYLKQLDFYPFVGESYHLLNFLKSTNVLEVSQVANQMLSQQREFSHQILAAFTVLVQRLEESPSTRAVLAGSLGNIRQLTLEPASQASNTVSNVIGSTTLQAGQTAPQLHSRSRLHISQVRRVNICDIRCACNCHAWRQLGAQGILSKAFGRGYVQTAGSPILGTPCDTKSCKAHAAPRISVQYYLPPWLASRMILMWFTSSSPCSPEFLLKVPRVVDHRNAAFKAVRRGNIESLKFAIMNGECTPDDVDEDGETLFSVRISVKTSNSEETY